MRLAARPKLLHRPKNISTAPSSINCYPRNDFVCKPHHFCFNGIPLTLLVTDPVHNLRFPTMRSHLTRSVFRRLLSNEGLTFRCPSQTSLVQRHRHNASQSLLRPASRRTLFGFSQKPPRVPKDPDLVPGFSKMVDLGVMRNINARPPPAPELVAAWRAFFDYKAARNEPINHLQARYVLRVYQQLQDVKNEMNKNG